MTEEFDIFKNLEDLRKTNFLDQLKNLETTTTSNLNDSQDLDNDDFDFDGFLNNNTKKSPSKRQGKKDRSVTPEKKSKKNVKSRRSSASTNGSISPTLPLLENLSKTTDKISVGRKSRRSLETCKKAGDREEARLENIEPSTSKSRGRGKGRGRGRGGGGGRGKGRANTTKTTRNTRDHSNTSSDFCDSEGTPSQHSSDDGSAQEEEDQATANLTLMERFLQNGNRARCMRARRKYVSELAARSTLVDYVDLASSPWPSVEGVIELDSDTEVTAGRKTRSKKKAEGTFTFNTNKTKTKTNGALDTSYDEDNPEMNVKVKWKGKPESFKLRKYQKFAPIFKELAERESISTANIVLNLNDRFITEDDTPESIKYEFFHFIDGRVLSNRFNSPGTIPAATKVRNDNTIVLKIQSDKWKRPLQIDLMKTDKFRVLYIKCAEELKVGLEQLKLSFDGELLEFNDTPADLDLEGGEAVDLRIKT